MLQSESCWVIRSEREDGERFRPSDWIERISATVAEFGADRRLRYATNVYPQVIDGEKCLVVAGELAVLRPAQYQYIIDFVKNNRLKLEQGPCCCLSAAA